MDKHYGQMIEKIIRRNGLSISELARLLNVNRRSFYNWFDQKNLKPEIIYRIITVLDIDFQEEFQDLFTPDEFQRLSAHSGFFVAEKIEERQGEAKWKNKYIDLLEKYNELLMKSVAGED